MPNVKVLREPRRYAQPVRSLLVTVAGKDYCPFFQQERFDLAGRYKW
jgi:hypothetical protein